MYMVWFEETMKKVFNIKVNKDDLSMEGYKLHHEEIDENLIPSEHLVHLPNPLFIELVSYSDPKQNEWIAGYVISEEKEKKIYEIWLKNGEPIAYETYFSRHEK